MLTRKVAAAATVRKMVLVNMIDFSQCYCCWCGVQGLYVPRSGEYR